MEHLLTIENLIALLTLTSMEIVLGIDNIVFLAILTGRLDPAQRAKARFIGLSLAMIMRILLLFGIKWIMSLTEPWFTVLDHAVSGRDMILLLGGLFLIAKATHEIHQRIEGAAHGTPHLRVAASFGMTIAQIVVIDLVFSLDSVITAVGMVRAIEVMVAAIVIAIIVMMMFAGSVSDFVERHPTIKMLALAFLLLIGVMLLAEGVGKHIERGYIYFAMAFSLVVEMLNIRAGRKAAAA
jgi:predicted tellurium resistance membrane protein TerC